MGTACYDLQCGEEKQLATGNTAYTIWRVPAAGSPEVERFFGDSCLP
jgi:hypothetical protein